jgi:hypothetical protein
MYNLLIRAWLRRANLSDGGGIRGYSSLLIMERLMDEIGRIKSPTETDDHYGSTRLRPCHYFDYMFGTSTGG